MRRYRSALILLLILCLMAGGYYFYTSVLPNIRDSGAGGANGGDGADGADAIAAEPVNVNLVDKKIDDLDALTVVYLGEEYVAVKEKVTEKAEGGDTEKEVTRWMLANRSDFRVDASKLSTAASNFCSISANKTVEINAADLGQYGFDGLASALVTGKFSDGSEVTLEIGDKNPTNDGYYVRMDGIGAVYLCSVYSTEKLLLKKTEIADLKLFAFGEADMSRIEMTRDGGPVFSAWRKDEYSWELDSPVIAPLNSTTQGLILDSLSDVSAVSCEELGAIDLAKYGLDKPKYTLRIECADDGGSVDLSFGDEKSIRSTRYVMLGGANDVFALSVNKFGYLDKPIKEFVDVFAYIVNINQVNHITASFDGRTVEMDVFAEAGSNSDDDRFFIDGVDISGYENEKGKSMFRALYQSMIGLTIYDIEPDSRPADENAEISFLYDLKDEPYTMLVEFVNKDDRLYYVFRNKEYAGVVVEKRLFDKPEEGLRAAYAAIVEAIGNPRS